MELLANPIGVLGVAAMAVGWAIAAAVFFTGPDRTPNRALALFLLLGSIVHGIGQGLLYMVTDRNAAYGLQVMSASFALAATAAYLRFLGTLPTPLTRPLRHPAFNLLLVVASTAWFAFVILRPELFVRNVVGPYTYSYTMWEGDVTPLFTYAYIVGDGFGGLLGLVASVFMIRASRAGTLPRRKALFYVLAFVVFDIFVGLSIAAFNLLSIRGWSFDDLVWVIWVQNGGYILFALLLGYGILRAQLFDIDLKLKFVLRRGTLAAMFVAVFLVVQQVMQNVLSTTFGIVAGGIATGLMLLALHPLQRLADRLADRAMPNVLASKGYLESRKADVYRDAVESLLTDGELTRKERLLLDRLRSKLELEVTVAYEIEQRTWQNLPQASA